jgi:predicted nucleic acid-binding protein
MKCMKPTVYVETSVISYLTSRASRDLVVAAHQEVTRQWWGGASGRFDLLISPMVQDEMAQGDPEAVRLRLASTDDLRVLPVSDEVLARVRDLAANLGLPEKALADIYHIAYCVAYEVDFLVTWNCTHIANPCVLRRLRDLSHDMAFFLPTIVTPDALLEDGP